MTNNNCVSFIFPRGSLFRFNNLFDIIDATFVSKSLFCVVRLARLVMPSLQCRTSAYPSCKQGLSRAAGDAARAAGRHPTDRTYCQWDCGDLSLHAQGQHGEWSSPGGVSLGL